MIKCNPVEMRKNLKIVNHFSKCGIDFVAVPVRNEDHKYGLIDMSKDILEELATKADESIKECSTESLKKMWDDWDKYMDKEDESPLRFHYEDIHTELNNRGEGKYCAV